MDAVHVLGGGFRVLDLIFLGQARVAMTTGAGIGQVQLEYGRIDVFDLQDIVGAVAIGATGGAGSTQRVTGAVDAGGVIPRGSVVAGSQLTGLGATLSSGCFSVIKWQLMQALV